ncbi:MAG: TonB-dependent receptor [Calditrichaeota bacterium]|nr:MAG: TonB-dependent receptor [Calditrichota bacterium]
MVTVHHNSRRFLYCFLAFCLSLWGVFPAFALAKGTIRGIVTDAKTGDPLPGANILLVGTVRGTTTDPDGAFILKVDPGTYTVRVDYLGYKTAEKKVTVGEGETVTVNFEIEESIAEFGETIVVLGSRAERTAIETPVPVDVISEVAVRESPQYELNQVLRDLVPSYNASHQTIADGSDHINPASLRGLGPDQVLVLINGKRRHPSALVHVNGTFGRGTVGVDLNAIPKAAIERIEVLRDGAAAQYGSDAIAGVINIVLKERTGKIDVNAMTGANNLLFRRDISMSPEIQAVRTSHGLSPNVSFDNTDGETYSFDINYGFPIGQNGFFNITGEYLDRGRTNRSTTWTGKIFNDSDTPITVFRDGKNWTFLPDDDELQRRGLTRDDFSMRTGQAKARMGSIFYNSRIPLSEGAEFYSFGGLTYRDGFATGFYRLPFQEARVNLNVYPNGFLPEIHTKIRDYSASFGVKGVHKGWIVDGSLTLGGNAFTFNIENSINASIGESSPTSFDAGTLRFRQWTGNLDVLRNIDTHGAVKSLSLAFGTEVRVENYQIEAGQFESYSLGNGGDRPGIDFDTTSTGAPKNPGSQVFPGFQPSNEVNRFRSSIGLYAELESDITEQFLLSAAGRFENYSDFGSTVNGKLAARYEVLPDLAFRGAVSTGFRAPSLHQIWFNNVSIQFVIDPNTGELEPARVLSASNKDPVTRAFGIPDLKEETSVNLSGGFTARPLPNLVVTTDAYYIKIDDRIVLTSRFTNADPVVAQILKPFEKAGVNQAQFFANAVDTKTKGLDIVAAYNTELGRGKVTVTASANFGDTEVDTTHVPAAMARIFAQGDINKVRNTLFNREERNRLEDALPHQKGALTVRYTRGPFSGMVRGNYYGKIYYKPTNPANDETFGAKVLIDLDLSYELISGFRVSVGANNLFNTFPDPHEKASNYSNGRFVFSRRVTQFGMNGGFYYIRTSLSL